MYFFPLRLSTPNPGSKFFRLQLPTPASSFFFNSDSVFQSDTELKKCPFHDAKKYEQHKSDQQ